MRMWSVLLQQKEFDQLVWNLGVHVRSDCKEWLEEPVITNASNLCSASRWNLMTLTVRWIALQNRSLCIDQLLQGSPMMLCLPFLNSYLLMELVQLCSLWRIQASLGQLVNDCLLVGQAMSVIAHCNALVGQAGSVIVSWMVGWLVKLSRLLSVHLIPTTMLFCRHGTTWHEAIIATPGLAGHHVRWLQPVPRNCSLQLEPHYRHAWPDWPPCWTMSWYCI